MQRSQIEQMKPPSSTIEPIPSDSPTKPSVGVVILNCNGKQLTEICVRSVLAASYPNKTPILVDNASTDGSVECIRALYPDVIILQQVENLGVAGGRNSGFREAARCGYDYILSLDNDARIDPQAIDALVAIAESDPTIGILGPKTYEDDGSDRIQCVGGRITYTQNVCSERGAGERDRGQYDRVEDVDYFPGFGFMAKREVFERLNFVDESFYGYGHEDTDFGVRAKALGYRIVYVPDAVIWHKGSATIGNYSPRKKYLEAVNSVYFVRKHGNLKNRFKYAFFAGFGLVYALIGQSLRGNRKAVFAKARGLRDGLSKPMSE
ncbi:glycosyltransferase family 2 protein [Altericista sp. CCNU0014]|uniref:glycosyltransferase family 2 protein n=1 Tax=Altericista sp. CCNU0014 TaxID=3082949 RepID=UPI00384EE121